MANPNYQSDKKILYVGIDDSNHAGDEKGDIIAATFSFNHKDSLVGRFPNHKDDLAYSKWVNDPSEQRDYRFVTLFNTELRHTQPNIPLVVPELLESFLEEQDEEIDGIKIYIDGILRGHHKTQLRDVFSERYAPFVVANFVKKHGAPHKYNNMVYMADTLASSLYAEESISENPKRIFVDELEILKRLNL
tara:strand:- start:354 stop:926 length:573 start_codon:yes stop_codon:yes gene_type:complete